MINCIKSIIKAVCNSIVVMFAFIVTVFLSPFLVIYWAYNDSVQFIPSLKDIFWSYYNCKFDEDECSL